MDENLVTQGTEGLPQEVEATPEVETGVAEATPQAAPRDADVVPRRDLDKLKSTYQRQQYEAEQRFNAFADQLRQRLALAEEELDQTKTAGMDETERERYRIEKELRKRDEAIAALQQEQKQRELEAQVQGWMQQEIDKVAYVTGAPYAEIEKHAGSPDELWQFAANFTRNVKRKAAAQPTIPSKVTTQRPSQAATGVNARWSSMTAQERRDYIERGRLGLLKNSDL